MAKDKSNKENEEEAKVEAIEEAKSEESKSEEAKPVEEAKPIEKAKAKPVEKAKEVEEPKLKRFKNNSEKGIKIKLVDKEKNFKWITVKPGDIVTIPKKIAKANGLVRVD